MASKAESIKAALEALANRNGGVLTPAAVVAEASNSASPLHGEFTWDDAQAAEERRLDQARALIRGVRIQFTVENRVVQAPYYVRDPKAESNEQGYVRLPSLLSDKQSARKAILREFTVAEGAMERAKAVAAILEAEGAIDGLILSARAFREQIEAGGDVSPVP